MELPSVALPPPPSASTYRPPPPLLGPPPSTNLNCRRPPPRRPPTPDYLASSAPSGLTWMLSAGQLLAALATSGINFVNDIVCCLLYFRRPSAARPPPPTKSPKFANNGIACPASCASCSIILIHAALLWLLPLVTPPRPHMYRFHILRCTRRWCSACL
jgi:hypothetical protein